MNTCKNKAGNPHVHSAHQESAASGWALGCVVLHNVSGRVSLCDALAHSDAVMMFFLLSCIRGPLFSSFYHSFIMIRSLLPDIWKRDWAGYHRATEVIKRDWSREGWGRIMTLMASTVVSLFGVHVYISLCFYVCVLFIPLEGSNLPLESWVFSVASLQSFEYSAPYMLGPRGQWVRRRIHMRA